MPFILSYITCVHNWVLHLSRTTMFNIVHEMQQYVSSFIFSQIKKLNVYVNPNIQSIIIGI